MRPIDADALMDNIKRDSKKAIDEGDKVGSFWLGYAAGSVIAQPTIQPQSTTGQLNDGARSTAQSTAQSTNLIDRRATIDAVNNAFDRETLLTVFVRSIALRAIRDMPSAQSEPTDEQVLDYCKKRCLHIVTSDVFQSTHLTHNVSFGDKDHVWIDGKQYISLRRFQEAVKEAQPKEGRWIEGGIYRDVIECNCSECGQLMTTAATVRMNYCPNCGAKMTISTK